MKLLSALLPALAAAAPTVTTTGGDVVGVETDYALEFKGIPFGAAGRFEAPQPAAPWDEPLDASAFGPACMQTCIDGVSLPAGECSTSFSEDCLTLNVYVPLEASEEEMPVLSYIYGGDFKMGDSGAPQFTGGMLANRTGAVVVTSNYRLASFGFLTDSSDDLPANRGLLDQQLAMQWVQDNAAAFGGDADRVTLFGQSAGAMSVGAHLSMASSDALFAQAIMESNPLALPFRDEANAADFALLFAKKAGCAKGLPGHKRVDYDCLRALDTQTMLDVEQVVLYAILPELPTALQVFMPFGPVVGGDLLPLHPRLAFQQGLAQPKPLMLGTNADEGIEFVDLAFANPISPLLVEVGFELIFGPERTPAILDKFPMDGSDDQREYMADIATDALFDCVNRNASLAMAAAGAPAPFVYHMDHPWSFGEEWWGANYTECWDATCHSAEIPFLWHPQTIPVDRAVNFTADEEQLSLAFAEHWGAFAATGKPADSWPDVSGLQSLLFTTPETVVEDAANADACDFWDSMGYDFS